MVSHGYEQEEASMRNHGFKPFRWYRCHGCGWEHEIDGAYHVTACGNPKCTAPCLHVHSDLDGEQPQRLPTHAEGCSNQNVLHPSGKWAGVERCGCRKR